MSKTTEKKQPQPKSISWHAYREVVRKLQAEDNRAALENAIEERDERISALENNVAVSQNSVSGLVGSVNRLTFIVETLLHAFAKMP